MNTPDQEMNLAEVKIGRMCKKMARIGDHVEFLEKHRVVQGSDVITYCGKQYLATVYLTTYEGIPSEEN